MSKHLPVILVPIVRGPLGPRGGGERGTMIDNSGGDGPKDALLRMIRDAYRLVEGEEMPPERNTEFLRGVLDYVESSFQRGTDVVECKIGAAGYAVFATQATMYRFGRDPQGFAEKIVRS